METRYPDSRNKQSIADGDAFERFVIRVLGDHGIALTRAIGRRAQWTYGDTMQGYEIKLDARSSDTKRLSIEIAERTALNRPWTASGIYADTAATHYVHGCPDYFWVFSVASLREWYERHRPATIDNNPPTIRRFYMAFTVAHRLCKTYYEKGKQMDRRGYNNEECDAWLLANGWARDAAGRWVDPQGRTS